MSPASSPRQRTAASIAFSPDVRLAPAASRFVGDFCRALLRDEDAIWRCFMAGEELIENIIKYSTGSLVTLEVALAPTAAGLELTLTARNETTPERIADLTRRLGELVEAAHPVELYDRLARASAPERGRSGLGLARIRAEGNLDLSFSVRGAEVTICARAIVPVGEEP